MADQKKNKPETSVQTQQAGTQKPECFIVMPISEVEGYQPNHFYRVFKDILEPACEKAGFRALRADQVEETNLIHLDILKRLLSAPMVLCDLSTRNPNVLFELALRMAFDKPVVLVEESGNPKIFDIAVFRITPYHKNRQYHEVLEDQNTIAKAITATQTACKNGDGINSIIKLLELTQAAKLAAAKQEDSKDAILKLILTELASVNSNIGQLESKVGKMQSQVQNIQSASPGFDLSSLATSRNPSAYIPGSNALSLGSLSGTILGSDGLANTRLESLSPYYAAPTKKE